MQTFEIMFSALALFECIIRITGDGFKKYWSDNWNRMDFIIVCCGVIDFFPGIESGALSALRTTRVLRPLRVVNRFPSTFLRLHLTSLACAFISQPFWLSCELLAEYSFVSSFNLSFSHLFLSPASLVARPPGLRMLVRLLLDTIPLLGSVLVLCLFLFSAFGIMGVQLWKGVLRGGCYNDAGDLYKPPDNKYYICSQGGGGMKTCPPPTVPGYMYDAEQYTTCNQTDQPNFQDGAISFDNIFMAFIAVFQVITLEDWSDLMYALQDGYSYWVWPFFVILILLGSWFATNLALVVIATQFKVTKKREAQLILQEAESTGKAVPKSLWLECLRMLGSMLCCFTNPCMNDRKEPQAKEKPRAQFTAEMTDEERQDLKMIQDVFDLLDQDQDGSISVEELRDALQVLDSHLPKSELKALAESIDVDGDGMIDFEEFRVLMGYEAAGIKVLDADVADEAMIETGDSRSAVPAIPNARKRVQHLVAHRWFTGGVVVCIAINTLSMAFEHHGQPEQLTTFIEITNAIFAFVFLLEVMLRIISVGPKVYLLNGFNVCDTTIVIMGVIEVFLPAQNLTALRSFRLLRLFKLARYLPTMQKQLTVMLKSLDSVMTFLLLLSLFIFMFAVMGMHLFGGRLADAANMTYTGATTRGNFDNFQMSVISVFQVLTTEEWNIMMYHAMHSTTFSASLYFIILIVVGTYILVNLFVAIMVEGFATDPEAIERFKAAVERARAMFNVPAPADEDDEETFEIEEGSKSGSGKGLFEQTSQNQSHSLEEPSEGCCLQLATCFGSRKNKVSAAAEDGSELPQDEKEATADGGAGLLPDEATKAEVKHHAKILGADSPKSLPANPDETQSTPSFKRKSTRKKKSLAKLILNSRISHWIILTFLAFDAVLLCIERPAIEEDSNERLFLEIADFICETIFTAEALLKIATIGFLRGPEAYMKCIWNVFDFTLLLSSWPRLIIEIAKIHTPTADAASQVFRIYRTVRPFRIIPRVPPVKQTMHMLYVSVRPVGNLLLVGAVFYIIFAILGVQMFKGKLYWCNIDVVNTELPSVCEAVGGLYNVSAGACDIALHSVLDKTDCELGGGIWQRREYNFDNVVEAVLTLFVVSSRDGWIEIMRNGMDVVGVDMQPQEGSNMQAILFFISFLLIVGYFVISMFVGVIVENFQLSMPPVEVQALVENDEGGSSDGDGAHGGGVSGIEQGEDIFYDRDGVPIDFFPYGVVPKYRIQRWAVNIVYHEYFEHVMAVIIFLNVLIMGCEHLDQPDAVTTFLEASNFTFTGIYVLEMILKILAEGPSNYFGGSWNRFDAFVAITSLVGCTLSGDLAMSNSSSLQAVRILRVARILKLMKVATGLSSLLTTVWSSMPQVMCMGLILLILFIAASALGIEMFGEIEFNHTSPSSGISDHANFQNSALAGLTLFRIATGDNWVGILRDTLASDTPRAPVIVYYVVFVVTAQFVLLNVVVAVLMKNLTAALQWVDVDTGEMMEDPDNPDIPIDVQDASPSLIIAKEVVTIAERTSNQLSPHADKLMVRPVHVVDGPGSSTVDLTKGTVGGSGRTSNSHSHNEESDLDNVPAERVNENTEDGHDNAPPKVPSSRQQDLLQVVDFNSDGNSGNQLSVGSHAGAGAETRLSNRGAFINPPERLLENLQERTARLSMRSQNAPAIGDSEQIVGTTGASRNKRALKASLHLVMAMVKMSGVTDIPKPQDGSRSVRLSIRKQVSNGRPSMMRASVDSRSSVRTLTRNSVNSRASFRSSARLSLNSRASFRSSVRPSINSNFGRRLSHNSHHRQSTNSRASSNRGSLRTSFATRAQPSLLGRPAIRPMSGMPETTSSPESLN